jgi:hypothetical protein
MVSANWQGLNSANVLDEGLWIGGKAAMEFRERDGTRRIQVHAPAVKDRYVLQQSSIWSQWCLQEAAIGGVVYLIDRYINLVGFLALLATQVSEFGALSATRGTVDARF